MSTIFCIMIFCAWDNSERKKNVSKKEKRKKINAKFASNVIILHLNLKALHGDAKILYGA